MEHTTLHLLYSRFWHKFLYDQKTVPCPEPYAKRTSHGMILGLNPHNFANLIIADLLDRLVHLRLQIFGVCILLGHDILQLPHSLHTSNSAATSSIARCEFCTLSSSL